MPVVDDPDLVDLEYAMIPCCFCSIFWIPFVMPLIFIVWPVVHASTGTNPLAFCLDQRRFRRDGFTWLRSGHACTYLGFQVEVDVSPNQQVFPVMQSMRKNLCYWSSQHLSLAGCALVANQIQSEGVTLQAEFRSALQAALLVSAKRYSTGPPQLLTQICLALSALVLRAVELKKPVEKLFASLSEIQGHGVGSHAILELLTVLPEEVIEENVVNATVNSERRWHFTQELLSHTGIVLEFLLKQTKDDTISKLEVQEKHKKVLRSLLSWVRVGCLLEIPQSNVASHPLLGFVFDSLQAPALFDLAVEVIVELVSRHEVNFMVSHGLKRCALFRVLNIPGVNSIPG
ncbi:hypothetical protein L7F22_015614 [Adiantum nelumboides]|nr:hypothetical protein [Adiantum nelumboides]